MSALSIQPPYPIFTGTDGQPLENGYIYIGTANLNPATNPIAVYVNSGLTQSIAQPIRTLAGYPVSSGTPVRLYVNSDYSILVQDKNGATMYSSPTATGLFSSEIISYTPGPNSLLTATNVQDALDDLSDESSGSSVVGFLQSGTGASNRTVQARLREVLSVKDFGALGNGVADDTTAIQNALNAGTGRSVYFPAGDYRVSTTLVVKTKTTLLGDGINKSIIRLTSGFSASAEMLRNEVQTGTVDVYYDSDIEVNGITFDGNNNATRTGVLLAFLKIANLSVRECGVQNNTYIGLAFSASRNVIVSECYFTNNGRPSPSVVSGPALWTDVLAGVGTPYDVRVENNYFFQNNWSAAYFMPFRGSFTNNHCVDNGESTIFSNSNGQFLRIENNQIWGATKSNISASGIECEGQQIVISGNIISDCGDNGIALTNVQNCVVSNNQIFNNGQDATFSFPVGIMIDGAATSPAQPDHIQIHGNRIGDRQVVKTQYAAIGFTGAGSAATRIAIYNNDFTEQETATYYNLIAARFGAGSYTLNNYDINGNLLPPFKSTMFLLSAVAGAQSITGIGFRPRSIRITSTLLSVANALYSLGDHVGAALFSDQVFIASDGTGFRGGSVTTIIYLQDGAGTVIANAQFTSFDIDGFTINVLTGNANVKCLVECYP